MTMRGKDRAALRAEAHHLAPTVRVGQQGLSASVTRALDDALRTRELVKVQIGRGVLVTVADAAAALADATGAEVVQVIGRTCTLYRENRELERRPDDPPPWRA
jgi:RNA-binding protein